MRLTLRTMLAYLDDVLSESDAEELGSKIERSDFASGLVHKIRNSIGRLRLSSPELLGHDSMDDPNTVAEFIDNALPPDKEQEFEKVCLQSDKHLAEATSCHQILALVLGTPARVDPRLRERVYRTASRRHSDGHDLGGSVPSGEPSRRLDQADLASSQPANQADIDVTHRSRTPSRAHADFRSIAAARGLWPIGIAVLVGFLATAGLLIAMGPLNADHPLAGILGFEAGGVARNERSTSGTADPRQSTEIVATPSVDSDQQEQLPGAPLTPVEPIDDNPPADSELEPQPALPQAQEAATSNDAIVEVTSSNASPFVPNPLIQQAPDLIEPEDETARAEVDPDGVIDPLGDLEATDTQPATTVVTPAIAEEAPEETVPDPAVLADVGRFLSENELLAFWDDERSGWMRLPSRTALIVGHRLRSLPTYRPQLLLAQGGIQVSLRGRSELTFEEPIDGLTPVIALPYGQLLMNAIGQGKSRVAVSSGERLLVVEFAEPDTEIAVHTQRVLLPGSDPQTEPLHDLIQIWVTRGTARIDADGATQDVAAGNQYSLADDHAAQLTVFTELPEWVYNRVDEVDRDAAAELETLLPVGRDLVLSLNEHAEDRRTDVRSLSSRCLVVLNDFEAGLAILSESGKRYQMVWPALFDELQAAVARGPETADDVYKTLEKLYGGDAGKLYRMLLGYTDEQLGAGAAAELVENLDNDRVEFRILSFENLRRMTGKTYLYVPAQSEKSRNRGVARWRAELRKGKVIVRQQPNGVAEWQRLSAAGS